MIGNGVVLDPQALIDEIAQLRSQGVEITPEILRVASNAPLILPLHRELDAARESSNAGTRIGTTKRGIGPAYEDKVGRRAIRLMDLAEPESLAAKVERLLAHHNALRRGLGMAEVDAGISRRLACGRRPAGAALYGRRRGAASTRRAAPASASCSRARKAPSSTSTTAPTPSSPRPSRWRARRRRAPASGRARSATCSASPRPIRRGSGKAPSRPSSMTRSARRIGEQGPRIRHGDRAQAALRLVRRGAGAPDRVDQRHTTASR